MSRRYSERKMRADILAWEEDVKNLKPLTARKISKLMREVNEILRNSKAKFRFLKISCE